MSFFKIINFKKNGKNLVANPIRLEKHGEIFVQIFNTDIYMLFAEFAAVENQSFALASMNAILWPLRRLQAL